MDKILCQYLGGSHLYGLNGPDSDEDIRGIFMNTDPSYILGLNRFDEHRKIKDGEDIVYKEVSPFIRLLKKANTEALEVLFAPNSSFNKSTKEFDFIRGYTWRLLDSEKLFKCLMGYMQGELRLALGIRKGKIGGKRYAQVEKLGFSPKNFTQLFRLAYVGIFFFTTNRFIVDTSQFPASIYKLLRDVKFKPEEFEKDWMEEKARDLESQLRDCFQHRMRDYTFDERVANHILLELYKPYLK